MLLSLLMAFALLYSIYFIFFLLLPSSIMAQTYTNVSLGSYLTAFDDNSSWASPSGEYAFGFQKIGAAGFLLAIWFDKIQEKTIVWSANGNSLVQRGSIVTLTNDGQFVLSDSNGQKIWAAAPVPSGASYAAMLDTGNFVLANQDSVNLWESFNFPSDTILPSQKLKQGSMLISRLSETNYSSGRFRFIPQNDGNLLLYLMDFPYWESKTHGIEIQVVFNQSGFIYLAATNETLFKLITSYPVSPENFYQRAILEYDGVFRQYIHPKATRPSAGEWLQSWTLQSSSYIPSNICANFIKKAVFIKRVSPYCGPNSYCMLGDDSKPMCKCPPGYTLLDPQNETNGCKQNFDLQSCHEKFTESAQNFNISEIPNMDWPANDYSVVVPMEESLCKEDCLNDCFCAFAIFRDSKCCKKSQPLSNGWIDPDFTGKAFIKMKINASKEPAGKNPCKKHCSMLNRNGSVLLGSSAFLNLILLLATLLVTFRLMQRKSLTVQPCLAMPGMSLQNFTYKELEEATDGFKEELGRGASATVYKGVLVAADDRSLIAVKRLDRIVRENEQEFKAELSAIGRTNHKNLVQLLGFCNEGQHRLLVYEFMSNGSLASFLFATSRPNLYQRTQVAVGIAKGLHYLHEESSIKIIHCDIKPQNILIDDSFTARISDFGLAKLLKIYQTRTTTGIRGTKGYVAPEWFKKGAITAKVDVYSFGVLLLEIICCRRNVDLNLEDEDQIILVDWAYDRYKEGRLNLLIENDEEAMNDMEQVKKLLMIAIWCFQEDPLRRPSMNEVIHMMEGATEVPMPPDPFIS